MYIPLKWTLSSWSQERTITRSMRGCVLEYVCLSTTPLPSTLFVDTCTPQHTHAHALMYVRTYVQCCLHVNIRSQQHTCTHERLLALPLFSAWRNTGAPPCTSQSFSFVLPFFLFLQVGIANYTRDEVLVLVDFIAMVKSLQGV